LAAAFLEGEVRAVQPSESAPHGMLLVFPNTYEVGMGNLGFQTVYRRLNELPGWRCERAFVYPEPWGFRPLSLERGTPPENFPFIGFSVAFELDFPNVVRQIHGANVPLRARDRGEDDPLLILGGAVAMYNPIPLAPFFDLVFIGEFDAVLPRFAEVAQRALEQRKTRLQILEDLAQLEGMWSPVLEPVPKAKKRVVYRSPGAGPAYSGVVSSYSHLRDLFLVEAGRGCGRRCRFCVASHVYWPLRMFEPDAILTTVRQFNPGARRIGLVGSALSDYPRLAELLNLLADEGYEVSLSSLRIDSLDEELVHALERAGVRSVALAPETGSPRMQRIIHKNLSVEGMLRTAEHLADSAIQSVKLYFIVGLPLEEDTDVDLSAEFAAEFATRFRKGRGKKGVSLSVNAFIPKPHTPFQWAPMADPATIESRRKRMNSAARKVPGMSYARKSLRNERLQAVLSLGGLDVAQALQVSVEQGVSLTRALQAVGVKVDDLLHREKSADERFPWEFIEGGPGREVLWREWLRAKEAAESSTGSEKSS